MPRGVNRQRILLLLLVVWNHWGLATSDIPEVDDDDDDDFVEHPEIGDARSQRNRLASTVIGFFSTMFRTEAKDDRFCRNVRRQFRNYAVDCHCDHIPSAGFYAYECAFRTEQCVNSRGTTFCATPQYSISFLVPGMDGRSAETSRFLSSAQLCATNYKRNSPGTGLEVLDDVCVTAMPCVENFSLVCSCWAEYGKEECSSCVPCDGGRGVQFQCGSRVSNCVRYQFPTVLTTMPNVQGLLQTPFVPQLV